jgi:hypothetical protein
VTSVGFDAWRAVGQVRAQAGEGASGPGRLGGAGRALADHRIGALAIGWPSSAARPPRDVSDLVGPVGQGIDTAAAVLLGRGRCRSIRVWRRASTVVNAGGDDDDDVSA